MRFNNYASLLICLVALLVTSSSPVYAQLQALASVDSTGQLWNYTLQNLEPADSSNWLVSFFLPISAPITNITSANGWVFDTDFTTFVFWQNVESFPYPNDIPPSSSATGFGFTSVASSKVVNYAIASWDHTIDDTGPAISGNILSPTTATAPEPSAGLLVVSGLVGLMLPGFLADRKQIRTPTKSC